MVMIIIHIAYITCSVINDAWYAYDVIGVYKVHLRACGISYFAEPSILRMACTVMGEVGPVTFNGACIYCGWLARLWARPRRLTFSGASKTVVG